MMINPRLGWGRSATTWQLRWLLSLLESSSQSPSGDHSYILPVLEGNLFRPGLANTEEELEHREGRNTTTTDTLLDLLTNCFPPNLVQVIMKAQTRSIICKSPKIIKDKNMLDCPTFGTCPKNFLGAKISVWFPGHHAAVQNRADLPWQCSDRGSHFRGAPWSSCSVKRNCKLMGYL